MYSKITLASFSLKGVISWTSWKELTSCASYHYITPSLHNHYITNKTLKRANQRSCNIRTIRVHHTLAQGNDRAVFRLEAMHLESITGPESQQLKDNTLAVEFANGSKDSIEATNMPYWPS